jgi:hypothetical protein
MSLPGATKPALKDIKTVTVECRHCRRTRQYTSTQLRAGAGTDLPPSQCVCSEPTKVLLGLISQAKHFNLGFNVTLEF